MVVDDARHAVPFDALLPARRAPADAHADDGAPARAVATPAALVEAGLFAEIAVPLKAPPFRQASFVMLTQSLADHAHRGDAAPHAQDVVAPAKRPWWLLSAMHRATREMAINSSRT